MGEGMSKNMLIATQFARDWAMTSTSKTSIEAYTTDSRFLANMLDRLDFDFTTLENEELTVILTTIRERGVQESRVGNLFTILGAVVDFLVFTNVRDRNPVPSFRKRYLRRYKAQRGSKVPRFCPSLELTSAIVRTSLTEMERTIHLFLAKTGVRRMSILSLNVEDVDLVRKTIRLRDQTKLSTLLLPMDNELLFQIEMWLHERRFMAADEHSGPFLVNGRGQRIGENAFGNILTDAGLRHGVHDPTAAKHEIDRKFTAHCYRHFFTTQMRKSGCPERILAYLRGDAPGSIRDRYDHVDFEEVEYHYNAHIWKLRGGEF